MKGELTEDELVVSARQQSGDCSPMPQVFFTLVCCRHPQDGVMPLMEYVFWMFGPQRVHYIPQAEYDSGNCDYMCFGCTDEAAFTVTQLPPCLMGRASTRRATIWVTALKSNDIGLYAPTYDLLVHGVGVSTQWVLNLPTIIRTFKPRVIYE